MLVVGDVVGDGGRDGGRDWALGADQIRSILSDASDNFSNPTTSRLRKLFIPRSLVLRPGLQYADMMEGEGVWVRLFHPSSQ